MAFDPTRNVPLMAGLKPFIRAAGEGVWANLRLHRRSELPIRRRGAVLPSQQARG